MVGIQATMATSIKVFANAIAGALSSFVPSQKHGHIYTSVQMVRQKNVKFADTGTTIFSVKKWNGIISPLAQIKWTIIMIIC